VARYQWFDAETQTVTTILIPKDGPCYISTRRGGHLVHAGRIPRWAAENAVEKYGYQLVVERDTYHRQRRSIERIGVAYRKLDLSRRGSDEEYAAETEAIMRDLCRARCSCGGRG